MWLKKLSIINFKNIAESNFEFCSGINCFAGNNGVGKTNIIDSIYYLSMCKSALLSTDNQIVRHGEDFFMLDGQYMSDQDLKQDYTASYSKAGSKIFKRGGKPYDKLLEHIGSLPVVMVSPQDSFLIYQSSEERRRYLNGVISQIDNNYLIALVRYNKVLQERNSLLKNPAINHEILEVLDMQVSDVASIIFKARREFISKISPLLEKYYAFLSSDNETVSLEYQSELHGQDPLELLQKNCQRDMLCGHTSSGVHRDDIKMKINGEPLKKYGSQGQQKSFLVALKLAQYSALASALENKPLLLFDDLFDKLDLERISKLLQLSDSEEFGQIFISDCNLSRLEKILQDNAKEYSLFEIGNEKD